MSSLAGKSAIVTGSTSGIGLGIAGRLAAAGARVMLNGFGDPAEIEAIRGQLAERTGVDVQYCDADLRPRRRDPPPGRVRERGFRRRGYPGQQRGRPACRADRRVPRDRWDYLIAVNLSAVFHCTREVLPGMLARNWGRIINIASAHGLVASVNKAAYVASKHGVVGLTKVAALETAETGVTVNAIAPGWVLTPAGRGPDPGPGPVGGQELPPGHARAARREATLQAVRDARPDRRPRRLPVQPRRRPDPRPDDRRRRGLDGPVEQRTPVVFQPHGCQPLMRGYSRRPTRSRIEPGGGCHDP